MLVATLILDRDDAVEGADLFDPQDPPGDQTSFTEVVQDRSTLVADPDDVDALPSSVSLKGFDLSEAKVPSAAGMRSPCGSRFGCPRSFANRSVNLSETACSNLSAS